MVKLDTTNPSKGEKAMTDYIGELLSRHGIPFEIIEPSPGRTNLVARIGSHPDKATQPPLLFISHTDVVGCEGQEWDHPPFSAEETDGMIYGRGTLDTKYLTAMQLVSFIEHKDTDLPFPLYFIASGDEEKGSSFGMPHVVQSYGEKFLNARVMNEGGGFLIENNSRPYYLCTAGEKGRCTVSVTIEGKAGPASFKTEGKAVDRYVALMRRITAHRFPLEETSVSRHFTEALADGIDNPFLEKFASYNAQDAFSLRSLTIGRQVNVLPPKIEFPLEIQMLPGRTVEEIRALLDKLFEGLEGTSYEISEFQEGFESSVDGPFFTQMEETAHRFYQFDSLLPVYALGRTDGRFLGTLPCDVYGFAPVTERIPFSKVLTLVHQGNEHIDRNSVILGTRFFSDLLTNLGN